MVATVQTHMVLLGNENCVGLNGIEISTNKSNLILTLKKKNISIYSLKDGRLVNGWNVNVIKQKSTITVAAVQDILSNNYLCVINKQQIRIWSSEHRTIEKGKKISLTRPVFALHSSELCGPVIVFEDGSTEIVAQLNQAYPLKSPQPTTTGQLTVKQSDVLLSTNKNTLISVLTETKNIGDGCSYLCEIIKFTGNSEDKTSIHQSNFVINIESQGQSMSLVDTTVKVTDGDMLTLICLWQNGILSICKSSLHMVGEKGPLPWRQLFTVQANVMENVKMCMLDKDHLFIAGILEPHTQQEILAVWDLEYRTMLSWQPLSPSNIGSQQRSLLMIPGSQILVSDEKGLLIFKFTCQKSTCSSMIGSQKQNLDSCLYLPEVVSWDSQTTKKNDPCFKVGIFRTLTSENQKLDPESYTQLALKFITAQTRHKSFPQIITNLVIKIIDISSKNQKFWPNEVLEAAVKTKSVDIGRCCQLLPAILERKDVSLLLCTLLNVSNISEENLVTCLKDIMSWGEDVFGSSEEDVLMIESPLSSLKSAVVDAVLSHSFNDVFIVEFIRKISFTHVLLLQKYLHHRLINSNIGFTHNSADENYTDKVIDWIALLFDVHFTQFILLPDGISVLKDIHETVTNLANYYSCLMPLKSVMEAIFAECRISRTQNIGDYCIEILHL